MLSVGLNQIHNSKRNIRWWTGTVYIERRPTVRLDTVIALYMILTAQFSDNANYVDTEIGAGAKLGRHI